MSKFGPKTKVSLFTGQWADLPLAEVAAKAAEWGYDGLEIAASGDHLDIQRAVDDPEYLQGQKNILDQYGLHVVAISNHLVGQCVCDDPIDFRHQSIVPERIWGEGDLELVRERAAADMKNAAKVARLLDCDTVVGFSGSQIWKYLAMFPPVSEEVIEAGYQDFADRWNPILDEFDRQGVRFALEVHPSEIAYDFWTAQKALEAVDGREAFGFNWDPSHMMWQGLDPTAFLTEYKQRIYHVHCKDTRVRPADGRRSRLASHLPWGDSRRGWDFVSAGRGDVQWEDCFRTLAEIDYEGPVSVEWEDPGMDRLEGAAEAQKFVRSMLWQRPTAAFDSAFGE